MQAFFTIGKPFRNSIDKCMFYDDESKLKKGVIYDCFLPLEGISGDYTWKRIPPLYKYSEIMNGEFFVIPRTLLKVQASEDKKLMPNSYENLVLKHYILIRIGMMERRGKVSRKIRYDTILKNTDFGYLLDKGRGREITRENNIKRRNIIKKTKEILNHIADSPEASLLKYEEYHDSSNASEAVGIEIFFYLR